MESKEYGKAIAASYYTALEVINILQAIGYSIGLTPEQRSRFVFRYRNDLADASIWERDTSIMIEEHKFNPQSLGGIVRLLLDINYTGVQAYDVLHGLLEEYGHEVTTTVEGNDAKCQVIYALRSILIPEEIRRERTVELRRRNAQENLSRAMETHPDLRARVIERMGNRGYFPQEFERTIAKELIELILAPETRKDFEERDGRLRRRAVEEFIRKKAATFDMERDEEPYGGFTHEDRNYYTYYRDFLYRKKHTSVFTQVFHDTRRRFSIKDHPTVDFSNVFRTEIMSPECRDSFLGGRGYDQARIVTYLMENYGTVEVTGQTDETIRYTLYVDRTYVKSMIKKIRKQME